MNKYHDVMSAHVGEIRVRFVYIRYYNTRRVQRNLGVLTPMEKHELGLAA